MLRFIARRLAISVVVLLGATALMYFLTAASADPLADLYTLPEPERSSQIAARSAALQLDQPAPLRYLSWLVEVGRCLAPPYGGGSCSLGQDRNGLAVFPQLAPALGVTLRLVLLSVFVAIVLGLLFGVVTAIRQHTSIDYVVTFLAFVCFSLPVFWVAGLLKEYFAIRVNDWLARPTATVLTLLLIGSLSGLIWSIVIGGRWRRRAAVFLGASLVTSGGLYLLIETGWFRRPGLGVLAVALTAAAAAIAATALLAGLRDRRVLAASASTAAAGVGSYLLLLPWRAELTGASLAILLVVSVVVSAGLGLVLGGDRRRLAAVVCVPTALVTGLAICLDFVLRAYPDFFAYKRGRPVATSGSSTPNLDGDLWVTTLDRLSHLMLPTLALVAVSFAVYTRYVRAGVLDTMRQEHVRTAVAKGLPTHTVLVRHVLRNSLAPIATLLAFDFAAVIGGSVVVETLFGWSGGMGRFFVEAVGNVDLNPIMAVFLLTSTAVVLFNLLADISYALLDPRVVVS